jgi:hypothetical protein
MGKYLEAIGIWEHRLGNIVHRFEPDMLDNEHLMRVMAEYSKTRSMTMLTTKFNEYYFNLVLKAYPELAEDDKEELRKWISINQMQILEDIQISHRLTKKEDLENAKKKLMSDGDALKNYMPTDA